LGKKDGRPKKERERARGGEGVIVPRESPPGRGRGGFLKIKDKRYKTQENPLDRRPRTEKMHTDDL
jgi:hypothetical protein